MPDIVDDLLRLIKGVKDIDNDVSTVRSRMAAREMCKNEGHRYRVHGKKNPDKVSCSRCDVSWAIGPRTEPS